MERGYVNHEYYDSVGPGPYGPGGFDTDDPVLKKRKLMNMTVCVDHLRGYCPKGVRCPKAHSDHVSSLDEREIMAKAKFCHDFQNRGVCMRATCRFLHVTRREEDEFLLTGLIPKSVFERGSTTSNYGGGRGPPGYGDNQSINDRYYRPPPPPPPSMYSMQYPPRPYYDAPINPRYSGGPPNAGNTRPTSTYASYCIDFLKGTCTKGNKCQLMHVDIVEDMDDREAIVKNIFCHDFQNRRCPRLHCKYVHANFDEQKVFIEEGYFCETLRMRNRGKIFHCDICIDYLRSQCTRGANCQLRHVRFVEEKEERICLCRSLFCHDFQESSCPRISCKMIHTSKEDEDYFLQTGSIPEHLHKNGGEPKGPPKLEPHLQAIAESTCRDFLKGNCQRGMSCRFYHPSEDEFTQIGYFRQKAEENKPQINSEEHNKVLNENEKLKKENQEFKARIEQLEHLLADACHCITLAVGENNPAIKQLMESINSIAPQSSLSK